MSGPPKDLSPCSEQVLGLVSRYTVFAWPVLTAQCRHSHVDPMHLDQETLGRVIGPLAQGVAVFTTPAKARRFEEELALLLRSGEGEARTSSRPEAAGEEGREEAGSRAPTDGLA
jgi:hypothetical protein